MSLFGHCRSGELKVAARVGGIPRGQAEGQRDSEYYHIESGNTQVKGHGQVPTHRVQLNSQGAGAEKRKLESCLTRLI